MMNSTHKNKNRLGKAWFIYKQRAIRAILSTLLFLGVSAPMIAQIPVLTQPRPSWWFGAAAGANFNFYGGSTQELNASITPPLAFHEGFGVGLYLAPTIEYYRPNSMLGAMLQFGYDNRKGQFDQIITTCNCPADLSANLSYITIEPSVRFSPYRNNFYLFAGPRFAINYDKSFVYQLGINRTIPDQIPNPEIAGDFTDINQLVVSMQMGAGVDVPISPQNKRLQFLLSPFVSFHPYFGQNPRSMETWNITTIRAGAALKFGIAKEATIPIVKEEDHAVTMETEKENQREAEQARALELEKERQAIASKVEFIIISPENIPAERTVRETFPLRNYVFFDLGSTEIPNRYVKLQKSQVKDFKEDQVELFTPENLSGRSTRQMVVYYNILNILGDRMGKNPNSTIKLVGSSALSGADGRKMAESVKTYLVDVFSIGAGRITTEGRDEPKIPSRQPGSTDDLVLLDQGDRRVSIESASPALLMEFQSGPNAPLKPIDITVKEEAPIDSYVIFENKNSMELFNSWNLEVKDDKGGVKIFGPFFQDKVIISGEEIMGNNADGNFKMKMIGTTKNGSKVEKEQNVRMVLWVPAESEVAMRFSVIYEFDESKANSIYEKYLSEKVVNKIPSNGRVIIHGHTDDIGDAGYNQKLSVERANDVKRIMESALIKQGRSDVTFVVHGIGEDPKLSPFENRYPEERFYNRTVLIDILPRK